MAEKVKDETPEEKYLQALRQIKQLQKSLQEDSEGRQAAIERLLARRKAVDEDLAMLGYNEPEIGKSDATAPKKRAAKTCSVCKQKGHTSRTCPQAKAAQA